MSGLRDEVQHLKAVDQHAHPVLKAESELPFAAAFTEATDPSIWERDTPHGLFYRRSVKQVAKLYRCAARDVDLLTVRKRLDLTARTALCLQESHLKTLLLDDGMMADDSMSLDWHRQFVPVKRLLRIEQLVESLLAAHESFEEFDQAFTERLQNLTKEEVGLKSIAAYRGGLDVPDATRSKAAKEFARARGKAGVYASPFYSYVFHHAMEIAHESGVPVQFHTGFGDPDLALEKANPLLLRPVIERYSFPVVLLHAGYPFTRETGFLSSVYSNVWVDFGLALPFLSVAGMRSCLRQLVELTPLNKLLYSSDASLIPELYYLGSINGRAILADVLEECVKEGDLDAGEASEAARWILAENAERLYSL